MNDVENMHDEEYFKIMKIENETRKYRNNLEELQEQKME